MVVLPPIEITDNLTIRIGCAELTLSPRQGLALAERLARKSFRRALDEEADRALRRPGRWPAVKGARR
jgi:hypothetical protein